MARNIHISLKYRYGILQDGYKFEIVTRVFESKSLVVNYIILYIPLHKRHVLIQPRFFAASGLLQICRVALKYWQLLDVSMHCSNTADWFVSQKRIPDPGSYHMAKFCTL